MHLTFDAHWLVIGYVLTKTIPNNLSYLDEMGDEQVVKDPEDDDSNMIEDMLNFVVEYLEV